jgi:hypothetical protein
MVGSASWENRVWYAILTWNLVVLVYLVFRAPRADASLLFVATVALDGVALAWQLAGIVRAFLRRRARKRLPVVEVLIEHRTGADPDETRTS